MRYADPNAIKNAEETQQELGLPANNRSERFAELEVIFREVMLPDVPSYDVGAMQSANFSEWRYTEGMQCFIASTQSAEINTRLMLSCVDGKPEKMEFTDRIAASIDDKWKLDVREADYSHVFFPPGGNAYDIVSWDNVDRAFFEDKRWMFKPHPITTPPDLRYNKVRYGIHRMIDPEESGIAILLAADVVGSTTTSEMGLLGMILGKEVVDFSLFSTQTMGTYFSLYEAIRIGMSPLPPVGMIESVLQNESSGFVHFSVDDDEARMRFEQFKSRTIELRNVHSPVVQTYPRPAQAQGMAKSD